MKRKARGFDWWQLVPFIAFVAAVLFFTWATRRGMTGLIR